MKAWSVWMTAKLVRTGQGCTSIYNYIANSVPTLADCQQARLVFNVK